MQNDIMLLIIVFLTGAIWGSFLNVCIYRIPLKKSIAKGRSFCPSCGHTLGVLDLVPLLSYLFQRGKCRYCKAQIPIRYFIVELVTAVLFLISFLLFITEPILLAMAFVLITFSVVAWGIMHDHKYIPDVVFYPSFVLLIVLGTIYFIFL